MTDKKEEEKIKKILGSSKYAGNKKKAKNPALAKAKKSIEKDRSLKSKIRNLKKEQERIEFTKVNSKKVAEEQKTLEKKIQKLTSIHNKLNSKK